MQQTAYFSPQTVFVLITFKMGQSFSALNVYINKKINMKYKLVENQ